MNSYSQQIIINKKNAEVWGSSQVIKGKAEQFFASSGKLYLNNEPVLFSFHNPDSTFQIQIELKEGTNLIVVTADNNGVTVLSDTLTLTLAYKSLPDIFCFSEVSGKAVTLKCRVNENPKSSVLSFQWKEDEHNPLSLPISASSDSNAYVNLPAVLPDGEYYFNLFTYTGNGDTVKTRTLFTVSQNLPKSFDILTDHAKWIDSAVIYEVTPYTFVSNGKFKDITNKIPDLINLGINTLWLQPVYSTYGGGQGYDIIDYFKIRDDLGTEEDLKQLIKSAKSFDLKIIFDFVPNHSSINHPYAVNSTLYGKNSHYWDYYQREVDASPYSENYHSYGGFINYFWNELPNLNYNNPEVRKWIMEAMKFWIKKYDIDGYRLDAVWGVTARYPQFTKDLRIALKTIKPDILLLGEDKASQPQAFDQRYDAAFDWTPEYSWVSHWAWQTTYSQTGNPTIFNYSNENQRANLLRAAITNSGNGFPDNAKVLHFMCNNDVYYFVTHHGVERTKMVAALLYTLKGIPMMYNGEEIGKSGHPYSTESVFYPGRPLNYNDPNGFFPYYQKLIQYRKTIPALYGNNYSELTVTPSGPAFGFRRWQNSSNVFTILNMSATAKTVNIVIPVESLGLDTNKSFYLTNLISGEMKSGSLSSFRNLSLDMKMFSAAILYLSDSVMTVNVPDNDSKNNIPLAYILNQNYPNPFNPTTVISYSIPSAANVQLKIFDILGKEVTVLKNEFEEAGNYSVNFNSANLSSGIYFYQLSCGAFTATKKMMIIK